MKKKVAFSRPDEKMLIAIGKIISVWAMVENVLPMHVGRLIACEPDFETSSQIFRPQAYLFAAASASGSSPHALLKQIENFMPVRKQEIRKSAEILLKLKQKRDAVAHGAFMLENNVEGFRSFGASRRNFGSHSPYTIEQMEDFTARIRLYSVEIDKIVTSYTKMTINDCSKLSLRWFDSQQKSAQKLLENLYRPESDPPANFE